eukprot:5022848-Prymnesium_polylepis.1
MAPPTVLGRMVGEKPHPKPLAFPASRSHLLLSHMVFFNTPPHMPHSSFDSRRVIRGRASLAVLWVWLDIRCDCKRLRRDLGNLHRWAGGATVPPLYDTR